MSHEFGGRWTELKLDAVEYYLQCYTNALTPRGMDLWYVDGFAGTGDRSERRESGGILDGTPIEEVVETLDGSARRALKIVPPFHHFHFIERSRTRATALQAVKAEYPDRDIEILRGEANAEIARLFGASPWTSRARSLSRAVVFLDPFAMAVRWDTLQLLAETEAVDVWYLFNVAAITRQLARNFEGVGNKEAMLDRVLSSRWRELYAVPPEDQPRQTDLFGTNEPAVAERTASKRQIDGWFKGLLETMFPFVSSPLPIFTPHSAHTFSLFLCVANPNERAIDLAKKFVTYVNKRYGLGGSASRRRSGR